MGGVTTKIKNTQIFTKQQEEARGELQSAMQS